MLILPVGFLLGTLASYLLFIQLIRDDLAEAAAQQVQALQPSENGLKMALEGFTTIFS